MKNVNNNKKHIAFFIPSMRGGGAEQVFATLANEFSSRNFKVDLILAQKEGPYLKNISRKVNIVDLKSSRILESLFPLVRYLKKEKPDILLSSLRHVNTVSIASRIISSSFTKMIIKQDSFYILPSNRIIMFLEKALFKKADHIVAVSKGVKKSLIEGLKIPEQKIKVIYNPIFKQDILKKSKMEIAHPFFENKKNKIILGAGRLSIEKDFSTLLKAFHKIKTDSIRLIILGEGRLRGELEYLVEELGLEGYVSMPGFVDNPYAYMAKADVFVLSSKVEGFANVLVEAMACGTTIVSTDCPSGPSEILDGGKFGRLVPVGNIEKLAEAISEALSNPSEKEVLINRAKMFSVDKSIEEYQKLFTT